MFLLVQVCLVCYSYLSLSRSFFTYLHANVGNHAYVHQCSYIWCVCSKPQSTFQFRCSRFLAMFEVPGNEVVALFGMGSKTAELFFSLADITITKGEMSRLHTSPAHSPVPLGDPSAPQKDPGPQRWVLAPSPKKTFLFLSLSGKEQKQLDMLGASPKIKLTPWPFWRTNSSDACPHWKLLFPFAPGAQVMNNLSSVTVVRHLPEAPPLQLLGKEHPPAVQWDLKKWVVLRHSRDLHGFIIV